MVDIRYRSLVAAVELELLRALASNIVAHLAVLEGVAGFAVRKTAAEDILALRAVPEVGSPAQTQMAEHHMLAAVVVEDTFDVKTGAAGLGTVVDIEIETLRSQAVLRSLGVL